MHVINVSWDFLSHGKLTSSFSSSVRLDYCLSVFKNLSFGWPWVTWPSCHAECAPGHPSLLYGTELHMEDMGHGVVPLVPAS